ncbi:MAG TPA: guanylate kinase [Candidatus Limnocylindrales bacterium]|nr:guanylate kinase [Candidatus Limnocylindrales bacterium]
MSDPESYLTDVYQRFVVVVSGPSGAGKSSFVKTLLGKGPDFEYSVSATTRPRRPHETEGRDYFFLTQEEFQRRVEAGDFVEHARVHGEWYGTLRSQIDGALARGKNVLLDIDVQGGKAVRRVYPGGVFIFILPPSMEALEARLRHRATDPDERIRLRLENARREIPMVREYGYSIVNDDFEEASRRAVAIVWAERSRTERREPIAAGS